MSMIRHTMLGRAQALCLACLIIPLAEALAAAPQSAHRSAQAPLAGHWMCASSPVPLRNLPGLPDGGRRAHRRPAGHRAPSSILAPP